MTLLTTATRCNVFIVDDDPAQLDSIRELLRAYDINCETFTSAETFLGTARLDSPGCLVVDIRMPRMRGLELQERLIELDVGLGVIVITGHGEISSCVRSMKRGAVNYLEKPFSAKEFISSVNEALGLSQRQWLRTEAAQKAKALLVRLSDHERALLEAVVQGRTNRQIAEQLDISVRAVQFRKSAILHNLEIQSFDALIALLRQARGSGEWLVGID